MTDSWQDYHTALKGLTGLEERLAVRRREADATLRGEYARAEQEKRRSLVKLDRTRLAVQTAADDLGRVRLLLGVEVPLQDPVRPISTVGQAEAAAAAYRATPRAHPRANGYRVEASHYRSAAPPAVPSGRHRHRCPPQRRCSRDCRRGGTRPALRKSIERSATCPR